MIKYKNSKVIDVSDWDKLVSETYGRPYSFQQQDGCKDRGAEYITVSKDEIDDPYDNDTIPEVINGEEMGVNFKTWLARDPTTPLNPTKEELTESGYYWGKTEEDEQKWKEDKSHIHLFWTRNFYPDVQMIANDLCRRGLIEPGDYTINIDW